MAPFAPTRPCRFRRGANDLKCRSYFSDALEPEGCASGIHPSPLLGELGNTVHRLHGFRVGGLRRAGGRRCHPSFDRLTPLDGNLWPIGQLDSLGFAEKATDLLGGARRRPGSRLVAPTLAFSSPIGGFDDFVSGLALVAGRYVVSV
jgi:hypothetical protein